MKNEIKIEAEPQIAYMETEGIETEYIVIREGDETVNHDFCIYLCV